MPRRRDVDPAAVDELLRSRERVVTHAELVAAGMPLSTVCSRIQRAGAWQRLHPGVVLAHSGVPARRERLLGALAYAGPGAVLTGNAALGLHGLGAARHHRDLHVLIREKARRQSRPGLIIERTRRLPDPVVRGGLPVAPPARALIDACRQIERLDDVRALVADAVQSRLCLVSDVQEALVASARQRTALAREVLAEVAAGVRSAAEARVRVVFARHHIPQPRWNWALHGEDGTHLLTPDGWWQDIGCALQIDSMAWHLLPALYKRTQQLQRLMSVHDIPFLPVAPGDVFTDEAAFVREVRAFLARHADHVPSPGVVARPPLTDLRR
ncbi:cysteine hydrolase family protein [Angustibacter luteus]|uniref:Uncharacterized protein n=1 Tax=Angustibacter luteus TaxID=658456 RepID=A0ABW1JH29_9ACTN